MKSFSQVIRWILSCVFFFVIIPLALLLVHLWSFGALYFSPIQPVSLRLAFAYAYVAGIPLFILLLRSKKWAVILPIVGFLCVLPYEWQLQPKTDAVYQPSVAQTAHADFHGDKVVLYNIRNFNYRTVDDFDVHWETREYDLKDIRTMDVYVNYWGMDAIAHVFVSFGFADGRYLAVSIEFRPEVGEAYGSFNGLFKQYEIIYVWSDERDVVRLRTNYRKENVYLYRTNLAPEKIRKMFVSMLERTNALRQKPEFYNTVTQSCTNTIGDHIIKAKVFDLPFWKRRILNGTMDHRLYEEAMLIGGNKSFAQLRADSNIDARAQAADQDPRFSQKIRTHLFPLR